MLPAVGAPTAVVMYIAEMTQETPELDPNCAAMPTMATAIIDEFSGCSTLPVASAPLTRNGIGRASTVVDASPMGIAGALVLANARPDERAALFRRLALWGLSMVIIGPLLSWGIFTPRVIGRLHYRSYPLHCSSGNQSVEEFWGDRGPCRAPSARPVIRPEIGKGAEHVGPAVEKKTYGTHLRAFSGDCGECRLRLLAASRRGQARDREYSRLQ